MRHEQRGSFVHGLAAAVVQVVRCQVAKGTLGGCKWRNDLCRLRTRCWPRCGIVSSFGWCVVFVFSMSVESHVYLVVLHGALAL